MSWETTPDGYVVETRDDEPGMSLRAEPGFESNAERIQATVTELRGDIAAVGEIVLYTEPDPGYPNANTNSTTAEVVSMRLTIPSAAYRRVVRVFGDQMFMYSQVEAYDVRLYLNSYRMRENRTHATPQNVFRSSLLFGAAELDAGGVGVVEFRHLKVGGTGLTTPSAGAGSWTIQVETQRITT